MPKSKKNKKRTKPNVFVQSNTNDKIEEIADEAKAYGIPDSDG